MDAPETRLFDALRADLLHGAFGDLPAHLAALAAVEARLGETQDEAAIAALRAEAERTLPLVAAAAAGVRSALRRLSESGAPAAVYAPDGRRTALAAPAPGKESRV